MRFMTPDPATELDLGHGSLDWVALQLATCRLCARPGFTPFFVPDLSVGTSGCSRSDYCFRCSYFSEQVTCLVL